MEHQTAVPYLHYPAIDRPNVVIAQALDKWSLNEWWEIDMQIRTSQK